MTTIAEKLAEREALLDKYEHQISLPPKMPPGAEDELQGYLSMDRNHLESLHPRAALDIAIRLNQFSIFLLRCINREKAVVTWAKAQLDGVVAKELGQQDQYMKHDAKVAAICNNNSAANKLFTIKLEAQQKIDRLDELHSSIKGLAYVISLVHRFEGKRND